MKFESSQSLRQNKYIPRFRSSAVINWWTSIDFSGSWCLSIHRVLEVTEQREHHDIWGIGPDSCGLYLPSVILNLLNYPTEIGTQNIWAAKMCHHFGFIMQKALSSVCFFLRSFSFLAFIILLQYN